ncbi:N-terminal cleavage protein [Facklamia sp. HMSC062C11]|uniref:Competence type IV pilus minor pilin ComGD n=1 Tax=Facklamia hominis TaxID=178214 RepID=A0AAJ1V2U7_9LACT|nr:MULTISPECIES: competence type IV pilus minor pilin ComGD [Facklamia]EPH11622.1 prepilin-type N-terminal cleavage/methylation domain-containing protein [Facklamia hominis ACS-120-V-Sch10]MDK7187895.1 competence type IV pilus minor pilin ComGD [Facklamia hominis]OFL66181.1 N-terminal cleavage protein [Facklamia sp. HMSC062C11]
MVNKSNAFTLIEMLITLMVVSLLFILSSRLFNQQLISRYHSKSFKDQIKNQLHLAQEQAVIEKKPIFVNFQVGGPVSFYYYNNHQIIHQINLPDHLDLLTPYQFYFLDNGHVSGFKSITFQDQSGENFYLVFQLGSGQFEFQP